MTGSLTFDDPDALAAWLTAGGVPLADWGRGEAKTVGDLWAEVACGETTLGDNPPRRTVSVVQVLIRRGERVAQLVIARHEQALWVEVETLDDTARGAGGFGSTGR